MKCSQHIITRRGQCCLHRPEIKDNVKQLRNIKMSLALFPLQTATQMHERSLNHFLGIFPQAKDTLFFQFGARFLQNTCLSVCGTLYAFFPTTFQRGKYFLLYHIYITIVTGVFFFIQLFTYILLWYLSTIDILLNIKVFHTEQIIWALKCDALLLIKWPKST